MAQSTLRAIAEHLARFFEPLRDAVQDPDAFADFLLRLGWQAGDVPASFAALAGSIDTAIGTVAALADDPDPVEVFNALEALQKVEQDLRAAQVPSGLQTTAEELAVAIVEMLTVDYLSRFLPRLYQLLRAIGVVKADDQDDTATRAAYVRVRVDWGHLAEVIGDPRKITSDLYGWGTSAFDFTLLTDHLLELLAALGRQPRFEYTTVVEQSGYEAQPATASNAIDRMLVVPLTTVEVGDDVFEAALALLELPAQPALPPGMIVQLGIPDVPSAVAITSTLKVTASADPALTGPAGVLIRPDQPLQFRSPLGGGSTIGLPRLAPKLEFTPQDPLILLGRPGASRLQLGGLALTVGIANGEINLDLVPSALKIILAVGEADSLTSTVAGSRDVELDVNAGVRWSSRTGLSLSGQSSLRLTLPIHRTIGVIRVDTVDIAVVPRQGSDGGGGFEIPIALTLGAELGPVSLSIQSIGVQLAFVDEPGNAGPFDVDAGFRLPNGVGIAVDAGSVSGGGFLAFDPAAGRYSGAVELSVYDIAVKAFGLVETKVPGGGFSFVVVISAEFTPIQLGFGFTLSGVGGLVGINRSVDATALANLVRGGQSGELLFPKNLIANAPAIIRDLGSVFPASRGHYVFGPLGKLGWGTPTLITGDIGVVLQIPGPVVVILGEVKCNLPKSDAALVKLNMSVDGELDFPNKLFALNAALHDSVINGFPVSGQMAMRVRWGEQSNFVLSVGGFHPAYQPPPDFPRLQPLAVDLGHHGAATITVSGFFAVTPNTLQVGGEARLHAGGSGISLDASVSVKALFVFSPFSFEARIDASVKISFHGHGPSVHLSGVLDGPSPWHIRGEVCVSILFWDACLRFDETFGGNQQVSQPELNPWLGAAATTDTPAIVGLQSALSEAGNWAGVAPAGSAAVVTLAQGAGALVDPMGGLSVRQKAVPVETQHPITRFGVAKSSDVRSFSHVAATLVTPGAELPLQTLSPINDAFAPAQYFDMDDGKKLSSAGYEQYQAGYVFGENANNLRTGSQATRSPLGYTTLILDSDGTANPAPPFQPTTAHVTAVNRKSAVALFGATQAGTRRFIDRLFVQPFVVQTPTFTLASSTNLTAIAGAAPAVRSATLLALDAFRAQNLDQRLQAQLVALHELA